MEEPKKVLKAQYLGSLEVSQPTGMEVINAAIETQLREIKREQWENVNVAVAPSMISINSSEVKSLICTQRHSFFFQEILILIAIFPSYSRNTGER